jgi:hypothetical protein
MSILLIELLPCVYVADLPNEKLTTLPVFSMKGRGMRYFSLSFWFYKQTGLSLALYFRAKGNKRCLCVLAYHVLVFQRLMPTPTTK